MTNKIDSNHSSAVGDTTILGHHVPKDVVVIFPTYLGMEESPGWYSDRPDEASRKSASGSRAQAKISIRRDG